MIEVACSSGDRVECCDSEPETIVRAARLLYDDHVNAMLVIGRGRDLTFTVLVDSLPVQTFDARSMLAAT